MKENGGLVNKRKYLALPLVHQDHHHGPHHVLHDLLRLIDNDKSESA